MESTTSEDPPRDRLHTLPNGEASKSSSSSEAEQLPSVIVPPYWKHHRQVSEASIDFKKPRGISLEDHTEEHSPSSNALWARNVTIADYVIVKGSKTGVGAYVVWNCQVQTLDVGTQLRLLSHDEGTNCAVADHFQGGPMTIRKRFVFRVSPSSQSPHAHSYRYSEFDDLRQKLAATFPHAGQAMPPLPPKSVVCKSIHFCR
jgi:hypothetical protein